MGERLHAWRSKPSQVNAHAKRDMHAPCRWPSPSCLPAPTGLPDIAAVCQTYEPVSGGQTRAILLHSVRRWLRRQTQGSARGAGHLQLQVRVRHSGLSMLGACLLNHCTTADAAQLRCLLLLV